MSICLHIYGEDAEEVCFKMEAIKTMLQQGFTSGERWDVEDGIDLTEEGY